MSNSTDDMTDAPATPAAPLHTTRPFYWSVRRELWENRSLFLAPLAVAALGLFGYLISTVGMGKRRLATLALPQAKAAALIAEPYHFAAGTVAVVVYIVAAVYCLNALHGERRDRSVLFWKSLPVSDLTSVLAKFFVPMVVLPVIAIGIILAEQLVMLVWSSAILLAHGTPLPTPEQLPLGEIVLVMIYGMVTTALWFAPLYGWMLMVGAWAKRVPFLWAFLPPAALCVAEKVTFNTAHLAKALGERFWGDYEHAYNLPPPPPGKQPTIPTIHLGELDPGKFLATPGLWIGLAVAAAFIAISVWLRRRREAL